MDSLLKPELTVRCTEPTIADYIATGSCHCSSSEAEKAGQIKVIHDAIEVVAYRALAEIVSTLGIKGRDSITEAESGAILAYVKKKAHEELFKPGGYIAERVKILDPSQASYIMASVARIIHDRDTKLTDARYSSLSTLVMAMDDHNNMVKEILLRSWLKNPTISDPAHTHLAVVKDVAGLYPAINAQLGYDLRVTLAAQQAFWDSYFPGKREDRATDEFVNIQEVRGFFDNGDNVYFKAIDDIICLFGYTAHSADRLEETTLSTKLTDILTKEEIKSLFEPRKVANIVRKTTMDPPPLLSNRDMTLGEFLTTYFPEKLGSPA